MNEPTPTLTAHEARLLKWLANEDYSQYGECHGPALDVLMAQGLVQLHGGREHQSAFVARGDDRMFQAVSLTEAGWRVAGERSS